jgi:eukaryotic-like serine/threonine-protein kinase
VSLKSGTLLGPYEIGAPLGAGGMGEVYRARDTRLDRTVAIKILPEQLSCDPVRKQRFEREAKTISSLNHPHICVLHDVGSQDGISYLVMECVEGETLAKRLEKGPLPLEQVLKYGMQIADALDKAHRSGVVHRDLKPGNIMLTSSGAKLLDFGLARPAVPSASLATLTAATPQQFPLTQEGMIVGTFQYMSPEQVEGRELDGRSDIFSLGAVLYEMLTGKRAFEGKSQLSVASAILENEPLPISSVKPLTPANLDHAIRRCLAKDIEDRWQAARDLAVELRWIGESGSQEAIPAIRPEARKSLAWLAWVLSGTLVAGLMAALVWWRGSRVEERTMYFSAPFSFPVRDMVIAPNGHTVAVVGDRESGGKSALWFYEIGSREARSVANTDGASFPFWSPDGRSIGFFAEGKLKRLDIAGGPIQTLCDARSGRGGSWNRDGVILFTPSGRIGEVVNRVSASGGVPQPISVLDASRGETSHRWPMFLPDGKHYLFMTFDVSALTRTDAIFVGSLDSKEKKFLTKATANAAYAAPGYLLFYRDKTLLAQSFDLNRLELTGEASPILTDIQYESRIAHVVFSVLDGKALVAQSGAGVSLSRLQWFDRSGKEVGSVGEPDVYSNVELAPNGKSVAVDKNDIGNQNTDVWIYDLQGGSTKRMTFDPAIDAMPVWSPDGKRVVFSSSRKQTFDLYLKATDGAQEEKAIEAAPAWDKYPSSWSRDGKYILYTRESELWFLTLPDLRDQLFLKPPSAIKNGQFSPDGKWVAYASNESGKWEIYVTSFPEAHGKWQASNGGGDQPRWRGDGRELFYLAPDGKIVAVPVKEGASFSSGAPAALFQANQREPVATSEQVAYDVTRNGQRFLINTYVKNGKIQPMTVVLNWDAESKKK